MIAVRQAVLAGMTIGLVAAAAGAVEPGDPSMLPSQFRRLLPLHTKLGPPRPGDWLTQHPESGQNFRQYVRGNPIRATASRRIIYVQPLGDFSPTQKKLVDETAVFPWLLTSRCRSRRVKVSRSILCRKVRDENRRRSVRSKSSQPTFYPIGVSSRGCRRDAVAMIAFTTSDLWPGEGWNYVFRPSIA